MQSRYSFKYLQPFVLFDLCTFFIGTYYRLLYSSHTFTRFGCKRGIQSALSCNIGPTCGTTGAIAYRWKSVPTLDATLMWNISRMKLVSGYGISGLGFRAVNTQPCVLCLPEKTSLSIEAQSSAEKCLLDGVYSVAPQASAYKYANVPLLSSGQW